MEDMPRKSEEVLSTKVTDLAGPIGIDLDEVRHVKYPVDGPQRHWLIVHEWAGLFEEEEIVCLRQQATSFRYPLHESQTSCVLHRQPTSRFTSQRHFHLHPLLLVHLA